METLPAPIIITEEFDVSVERLWSALTVLKEMQQWYFLQLSHFEPHIGFETKFTLEHEGRVFPHVWNIVAVDAPNMISYTWTFDGYAGKGITTFSISDTQGKAILTLEDIVLKPYPDEIPEFKRESSQAGWTYLIKTSLKNYLNT